MGRVNTRSVLKSRERPGNGLGIEPSFPGLPRKVAPDRLQFRQVFVSEFDMKFGKKTRSRLLHEKCSGELLL